MKNLLMNQRAIMKTVIMKLILLKLKKKWDGYQYQQRLFTGF